MEWGNWFLVIYLGGWLFFIRAQIKRIHKIGPATMVMITYCAYGVFALLYYNSSSTYFSTNEKLTFIPFVYLFTMLCIALAPGIYYERADIRYVKKASSSIIDTFIIVYFICSLVHLPSILPKIPEGIALMLLEEQGGLELYLENSEQVLRASDNSISGLLGLTSIFRNVFRDIIIFLLFYYLALREKKTKYIVIILFTVLVDVLYSLSLGQRNYLIIYLFMIAVGYFLFQNFIDTNIRKWVKRMGVITVILLSIPFIAITIARFSNSKETTPLDSAIQYAGQAPVNFNLYVFDTQEIRYGDRTVNLFKKMLGFDVPNDHVEAQSKYTKLKVDDRVFYTFVGDFVLDFGVIVSALIFLFITGWFLFLTSARGHTMRLHQMLVLFFSLNICAQGGMYLFSYAYADNWKIVGYIVFYCILAVDSRNTSSKASNYLTQAPITTTHNP